MVYYLNTNESTAKFHWISNEIWLHGLVDNIFKNVIRLAICDTMGITLRNIQSLIGILIYTYYKGVLHE